MPKTLPIPADAILQNEHFDTHHEDWNEYELEGGLRVRVRVIVTAIARARRQDGKLLKTEDGDPMVRVGHSVVVTAHFKGKTDA